MIRSLYRQYYGKKEPNDLKELFLELKTEIFSAVYENKNWNCTKLHELHKKPEEIFNSIDALNVGKKWSKDQKYFFKAILKFIAARNYFAHHSCLDESMDGRGELAGNVLKACLHSLLYVENFLKIGDSGGCPRKHLSP